MLLEIEASLVDRLRAGMPEQIRVAPWPDKPLEFARPQNIGTIFVRIGRLKLLPRQSASYQAIQDCQLTIELRLLLKDLRSHVGAYPSIELAQRLLTGWKHPNQDGYAFKQAGLQLLEADLVERVADSGQWDWGMIFAAELTYQQPQGDQQ